MNSRAVDHVETVLRSQGEESETKLIHVARNSLGDLRQRLDQQSHRFALVSVTQLTRDASARPNIPADLNRIKPPPKPPIFHGREDLVQTIVDLLLKDETCRVPLLGAGGIGKTALVTTILNDERVKKKFGENVFFLSCESLVSASGIILALASALGLQQDAGARQAVIHYFSSFKYVLLALDNFETTWDSDDRAEVEALLAELAAVSPQSLFVTMRGALRPAGVDWTDCILDTLDPLSLDAARRMWMRIAKKVDSKLDDLLRLLDGLPLAIMLMAQQGQVLSSSELLTAYTEERTSLLSQGAAGRLTSLEVSIELSLNSRTMQAEPNARKLLSVLCLLPDGIPMLQLNHMLPSMPHAGRSVRVLLHAALAVNKAGRISTLSPIREFMLQKYPPEDADVADTRAHFTGLPQLMDRLNGPKTEALDILLAEFGNMNTVFLHFWRDSPGPDAVEGLLEATLNLAQFSVLTGCGDCMLLLRTASISLDGTGNRQGAAQCLQSMGNALPVLKNRYSEAMEKLEEAKATFEAIGNRWGAAECTQRMGDVLRMQNRYEEAMEKLEEAKATFESIGNREGVAQCVRRMGDVLYMWSRYEEATEKFEEAKVAFQAIGSHGQVALCCKVLAEVFMAQHKTAQAQSLLHQAIDIFTSIGLLEEVHYCRSLWDELQGPRGLWAPARRLFRRLRGRPHS
ncbi:hypothetical protein CALVIDRAFT_344248 [Calocera viscosa TUFC12733]|uniref:NACHT domain-containing protein n=1 Tax=Calocera viscosa (strain TUFC12733) TaxID=1330018 RepID=A0A167HDA0_CALVF|nr:hypothetical protein CALVIDRAFT_344248 [Calocera viscosa TUFC12733]